MATQMQFQKNATVLSANGESIARLDRVVLNPETRVVTHLVVHKGSLFTSREKVVPIEMVTGTNEDQIALCEEAGDLGSFPPFEETHLVDTEGDAGPGPSLPDAPPPVFGAPGVGVMLGPTSGEKFTTQIDQNIPDGTVAMKEGARVITAEGKRVGSVERVIADAPAERATHLLVSMGMFTKETKLVPIKWVSTIDEGEVHLRVEKNELEKLDDLPLAG
jgi:uncharacterized protein YrrD